jgi:hypothetical protein
VDFGDKRTGWIFVIWSVNVTHSLLKFY